MKSLDYAKFVFRPGDILFFSGKGAISSWIKFSTCSRYSHVGICAEYSKKEHSAGINLEKKVLLFESTSLNNLPCVLTGQLTKGVQAQIPADRIYTYNGKVYISHPQFGFQLNQSENKHLLEFLVHYLGTTYDTDGAILSKFREIYNITPQSLNKLFCSEYVIAALKVIDRYPLENASKFTPGHVARELVKRGIYTIPEQIK